MVTIVSEDLFSILDRLKKIGYDWGGIFVGPWEEKAFPISRKHCQDIGLEVTTVTGFGSDWKILFLQMVKFVRRLREIRWGTRIGQPDLNSQVLCGPFHSAFATFAFPGTFRGRIQLVCGGRAPWNLQTMPQKPGNPAKLPKAQSLRVLYLCITMEQLDYLLKKVNHSNVQAMFGTRIIANMEERKWVQAIEFKFAPRLGHFAYFRKWGGGATPGSGSCWTLMKHSHLGKKKWIIKVGWLSKAFQPNDLDFATRLGVWRNFSEPWDMAENGFKLI